MISLILQPYSVIGLQCIQRVTNRLLKALPIEDSNVTLLFITAVCTFIIVLEMINPWGKVNVKVNTTVLKSFAAKLI